MGAHGHHEESSAQHNDYDEDFEGESVAAGLEMEEEDETDGRSNEHDDLGIVASLHGRPDDSPGESDVDFKQYKVRSLILTYVMLPPLHRRFTAGEAFPGG